LTGDVFTCIMTKTGGLLIGIYYTQRIFTQMDDIIRINPSQIIKFEKGPVGDAKRRAVVERLWVAGLKNKEIAEKLDVSSSIISKDIDEIKVGLATRRQLEELRSHIVNRLLDVSNTSQARYEEEEITMEGKLLIDSLMHIAKISGLTETQAEKEVSGALGKLFNALSERMKEEPDEDSG